MATYIVTWNTYDDDDAIIGTEQTSVETMTDAKRIAKMYSHRCATIAKAAKAAKAAEVRHARFHIATGLMVEIVEERQNNNLLVHLLNADGTYAKYFEIIARSGTELRAY